jgi:hypothetical protein
MKIIKLKYAFTGFSLSLRFGVKVFIILVHFLLIFLSGLKETIMVIIITLRRMNEQ